MDSLILLVNNPYLNIIIILLSFKILLLIALRSMPGLVDFYNIKIKKEVSKESVYPSYDGKGYFVRIFKDEVTYVPIMDLYPKGTDYNELMKVRKHNKS